MYNDSIGILDQYTSGLDAIFKDKIYVLIAVHVATGTIVTSQVNAEASS